MKNKSDSTQKWIRQYFNLVYNYTCYTCGGDRSLAEKIAEQTFDAAHRNARKLKKVDNVKARILNTARYFILKEVYRSWERGENISEKYNLPDALDPETIQRYIAQYEEM